MLSGLLQLTSENSFQELMIPFPLEWLLVVLLILAPVAWWYRKVYGASSVRSLPPGPVCLPLLGSAPWLLLGGRGFAPHLRLAQLADRYGDVMTLVVGSKLVVVVSGAAAIREALGIGGDALAGRPPLPLPLLLNHGKGIIFTSPGPKWCDRRRFISSALNHLVRNLQTPLAAEAQTLRAEFDCASSRGMPFDPKAATNRAASALICRLCLNHGWNSVLDGIMTDVAYGLVQAASGPALLVNLFPWLIHLPTWPVKPVLQAANRVMEFLKAMIMDHEMKLGETPRDLVDLYLLSERDGHAKVQEDKSEVPDNCGAGEPMANKRKYCAPTVLGAAEDREELLALLGDLLVAGSDTTGHSLHWALLHMALRPEIQARVQAEIDREVEQTRLPNVRDRSHLHYTEATLREVMRCSAVVPLALPHFTLCEISLHGYTIPVNTTVLVNLWSAHHDPRVWRRPTEFDPSRFLDAQEELLWPAAFMPFGIGRRACPGAQIARAELFVLFSSILQAFTLIPASSPSLGNLQGHFGLTLAPPQFKLHLHPRR